MSELYKPCESLLNDVKQISSHYDEVYRLTGAKFNIFQILRIKEKEVLICRFLTELLSPSGSHGQRSLFLKPFVKNVLKLTEIPDSELERAAVSSEVYTQDNRRIDIVIRTKNYFIAVEVKINASDSNNQCKDYYEEAKRHCRDDNAKIFYLTPDGREPAETSRCGCEICISFKNDVREWLLSCLNFTEIEYAFAVRELIKQFLNAVASMEDNKMCEIKDLFSKDAETGRAAKDIALALTSFIKDKRQELLEAVRDKVREDENFKNREPQGINDGWLKYEYDNEKEIFVTLEIAKDDCTYVAFTKDGVNSQDEFRKAFHKKFRESRGGINSDYKGSGGKGYIDWEICYVDDKNSPNFWFNDLNALNDATIDICFDQTKFDEFVEQCAEKIKAFLDFKYKRSRKDKHYA